MPFEIEKENKHHQGASSPGISVFNRKIVAVKLNRTNPTTFPSVCKPMYPRSNFILHVHECS